MNKDKQIDLIEKAMQNAYGDEPGLREVSADWKSSLMASIKKEYSFEAATSENLENKFLRFSWVAAGIAATLIIVAGVLYSIQNNDIESDIQELYADNSMETLTMVMVGK